MRIFLLTFLLFTALFTNPVHAQFSASSFTGPDYGLALNPEFPRPGELVTVSLNDYRSESQGASISWLLDGTVVPGADNQRQVSVNASPTGKVQTIEAVLTRISGTREVVSAVLRPVYLDVVIEAQTRVPEFYLGRSLPSIGSTVNATAIVSDGKGLRNADLIYSWKLGQQALTNGPVRGQNRISYTTPMGEREILTIQVSELDGTIIARRSFFIPSVQPEIHFYEVNALFGISKKSAAAGLSLISNSLTVRAEPYYLDTRIYNQPAVLQWEIGGSETNNSSNNPYEITLERTGVFGSTEIGFHVRDTKQVLQGVEGSTRINF